MTSKYPKYAKEVQELLATLDNGHDNHDTEPETEIPATPPNEPIKDIYVLVVREEEEEEDEQYIVDSQLTDLDTTPFPIQPAPQPASNAAIGVWFFGLFVMLSCLMFQFYVLFNPLTVSVTLAARSQQVSLTGTLQLGRVLNPITLSQSQTVSTTGHGHQDAKQATGYITFYNGQLTSVFIPVGTTLTGNSGVQIITDQDANIPAANLPQVSQATVSAHAVHTGSSGNIASYDINQGCCNGVKAVNTTPFSGGQDERNFQTVAKSDIDLTASQLKATLNQGTQGALQGELKAGEVLTIPACNPTVTPDHQLGQETTTVKVTVSETCSGTAYNDQELTSKVTQLLTTQATKKLDSGYSMLENPHITVTSALPSKPVTLSFRSVSTWVYALTTQEQHHIKKSIAGKYIQNALQLLYSLPGIESVSLHFSGFGDNTKLPKEIAHMHLLLLYTTT